MSACETCGAALPAQEFGRPRRFCSERCRKRQYDLTCVSCGGRVDGTTPSRLPDEPVCRSCAPDHYSIWTPDSLVCAIQDWAEEYGVPPSAEDWNVSQARRRGKALRVARFGTGRWPNVNSVQRVFGTWNAGIRAAGFEPNGVGHYGRDGDDPELCAEIRERYEAGESAYALAREYGCKDSTITYRIRKAGGQMRSHAEAMALRRERAAA